MMTVERASWKMVRVNLFATQKIFVFWSEIGFNCAMWRKNVEIEKYCVISVNRDYLKKINGY